jgi:hypothetical protein
MTAVAANQASFSRIEPGSFALVPAEYPTSGKEFSTSDPSEIVEDWVKSFNKAIASPKVAWKDLFLEDSYWRDQLCISWDFHTWHGPTEIESFTSKGSEKIRLSSIRVDASTAVRAPCVSNIDFSGKVPCVQSFLTVETTVGTGRGLIKLLQDGNKWKAFTLFTSLRELHGHGEPVGRNRPNGVAHGGQPGRKNWKERREAEVKFEDSDPVVLILGKTFVIFTGHHVNAHNQEPAREVSHWELI